MVLRREIIQLAPVPLVHKDKREGELTFEEWKALDHCLQLYGHYAEVGQSYRMAELVAVCITKRMGEIVAGLYVNRGRNVLRVKDWRRTPPTPTLSRHRQRARSGSKYMPPEHFRRRRRPHRSWCDV